MYLFVKFKVFIVNRANNWKFEFLSRAISHNFSEKLLLKKNPAKNKTCSKSMTKKSIKLFQLMLFGCLLISLGHIFKACGGNFNKAASL